MCKAAHARERLVRNLSNQNRNHLYIYIYIKFASEVETATGNFSIRVFALNEFILFEVN